MMFHSILVNSASGTTQKSNELNFRMWFTYGLKAQKLQELLPFTFALPFGQRFSIPFGR